MEQITDQVNLFKEIILPLTSIFISVVTIYFLWTSLKIQRQHNVKSIKPIGKIRIGDYESNIFIRIDNSGIGPLILKKVILNNTEITHDEMLLEKIPYDKRKNIRWKNFSGNYFNRTISVNDNLELIWWTPETDFRKKQREIITTKKNIRSTFQNWSLKIEYTDVYESEVFTDQLDLNWFGRNVKK